MEKELAFHGEYSKPSQATNYKAFDYSKYLKTKKIYGIVTSNTQIKISKKTYLNQIYIISNKVKSNIEKKLDEILGENSGIAKRNTARRYRRY